MQVGEIFFENKEDFCNVCPIIDVNRKETDSEFTQNASILRQLSDLQFTLFSYISALTGNSQDARDILQDTDLRICREIGQYDPAKPFAAWAKTVAFYEVKGYRQRCRRSRLSFDNDTLELIASEETAFPEETPEEILRLRECMGKLPETWKQVVTSRYLEGGSVNDIAAARKCSPNAVSHMLMRARESLAECIRGGKTGKDSGDARLP